MKKLLTVIAAALFSQCVFGQIVECIDAKGAKTLAQFCPPGTVKENRINKSGTGAASSAITCWLELILRCNSSSVPFSRIEPSWMMMTRVQVSSTSGSKCDEMKTDRKSTRLNSSHTDISRMPSSA